jgi:hypothetical protein
MRLFRQGSCVFTFLSSAIWASSPFTGYSLTLSVQGSRIQLNESPTIKSPVLTVTNPVQEASLLLMTDKQTTGTIYDHLHRLKLHEAWPLNFIAHESCKNTPTPSSWQAGKYASEKWLAQQVHHSQKTGSCDPSLPKRIVVTY